MKKIIVAPLNWGLGHASRCVPIIKALQEKNFTPVVASDGKTLEFLQKEFPELETIKLPSYQITYGKHLKWNLLKKGPTILKAARKEREIIHQYLGENKGVVGIISDNRFGVRSSKVPSVYITHQINVLSGILTPLTSYFHQRIIKKFDECWIPDEEGSKFSGRLSRSQKKLNQKYIGVLSRFQKKELEIENDILIVLSGPEPNRTQLENKLQSIFSGTSQKVLLVQGIVEAKQKKAENGNITIVNYMLSSELEKAISSSEMVICRSGYSSIMDLITLNKKAILIPTKGQNEQEYLAQYLNQQGYFSFVDEDDITAQELEKSKELKGEIKEKKFDKNLFRLFQSK